MQLSDWKENLERERKAKDWFLAVNLGSPIPPEQRAMFKGLNYYPPNSNHRFELKFNEHEEKKIVKMIYTKGGEHEFYRWGEFLFTVGGKIQILQIYKRNLKEKRFFVPFRDLTNGKETYGAGRYLDLEAERHCISNDEWILDFNEAYNPWCAFSETYACPIVPSENWLDVSIRAGEKKYKV